MPRLWRGQRRRQTHRDTSCTIYTVCIIVVLSACSVNHTQWVRIDCTRERIPILHDAGDPQSWATRESSSACTASRHRTQHHHKTGSGAGNTTAHSTLQLTNSGGSNSNKQINTNLALPQHLKLARTQRAGAGGAIRLPLRRRWLWGARHARPMQLQDTHTRKG